MVAAAPMGSVSVGRYRLDVGDAAGTLIAPSDAPPEADSTSVARALRERGTLGAGAEQLVDDASEVTSRTEQAVALLGELAAGRMDPRSVSGHVDLMLDMLERLDRQGRWTEARRLARALSGLLALLLRWVDLVRSLNLVRATAERLHDRAAVAWSEHELGTLNLAAGDVAGANRRLGEAERIRRELEDRAGLAATEHNLRVLCRELRDQLPDDDRDASRRRLRRLVQLAAAAVLLVLIGGVAGARVDGDGDDRVVSGGDQARLVVRTDGPGGVTSAPAGVRCPPRCEVEFPLESAVVLAARPASGATFAGWSGGTCGGATRCALRLGGDTTITARFRRAPPGTATLRIKPPTNGTVTSDPSGIACPQTCERPFETGTRVTLTAAPAEGFTFSEWSDDCSGADRCVVTMTADRNVGASFVTTPTPTVDVTVTVSGDGSVTSEPAGIDCGQACTASFVAGDPLVLSASPGLLTWGGACAGAPSGSPCTFTPQANASVTADFPEAPEPIP